jgi:hypothetical protein
MRRMKLWPPNDPIARNSSRVLTVVNPGVRSNPLVLSLAGTKKLARPRSHHSGSMAVVQAFANPQRRKTYEAVEEKSVTSHDWHRARVGPCKIRGRYRQTMRGPLREGSTAPASAVHFHPHKWCGYNPFRLPTGRWQP